MFLKYLHKCEGKEICKHLKAEQVITLVDNNTIFLERPVAFPVDSILSIVIMQERNKW